MTNAAQTVTISANIQAPLEKVWDCWTQPHHIVKWNHATPEWHTPTAENDLQPGGHFNYRMEAKDGSMGFDFSGVYDRVVPQQQIAYTMGDGRKVNVEFSQEGDAVRVQEVFEAEQENSIELQQMGWQAILDQFKSYTESV